MTGADTPAGGRLVTVVMPTFNGRRLIASSLASLQTQDYRRLEIIVVDDGSTDDTATLVAAIASGDERVRLLRSGSRNIALARNTALSVARGEFISFLDHDDICPPGKVARQVAVMTSSPSAAAVFGQTIMFASGADPGPATEVGRPTLTMCLSAALFRRDVFERVGRLDPRFKIADDLDFILRLVEAGAEILIEDRPATLHRRHPGQVTSDHEATRREMALALSASLRRRRATGDVGPLRHPLLSAWPG